MLKVMIMKNKQMNSKSNNATTNVCGNKNNKNIDNNDNNNNNNNNSSSSYN